MSRINLVRKNFTPLGTLDCELTCYDVQMVPFYLGALWLRAQKYWWVDAENAGRARSLLNEQMVRFLMPCGQDIVDAIETQTRHFLGAMQGYEFNRTGTGTAADPYVWEPPLPDYAGPQFQVGGIERSNFFLTEQLQNLLDGTPSATTETRNFRQQLQDIYDLLASGGAGFNDDEIIEKLLAIIAALG